MGHDSTVDAGLAARIQRAGTELADLVTARDPATTADPFETPTPFTELLRAS